MDVSRLAIESSSRALFRTRRQISSRLKRFEKTWKFHNPKYTLFVPKAIYCRLKNTIKTPRWQTRAATALRANSVIFSENFIYFLENFQNFLQSTPQEVQRPLIPCVKLQIVLSVLGRGPNSTTPLCDLWLPMANPSQPSIIMSSRLNGEKFTTQYYIIFIIIIIICSVYNYQCEPFRHHRKSEHFSLSYVMTTLICFQ